MSGTGITTRTLGIGTVTRNHNTNVDAFFVQVDTDYGNMTYNLGIGEVSNEKIRALKLGESMPVEVVFVSCPNRGYVSITPKEN